MALVSQVSNGLIYGQRLGERQIRLLKILPSNSNSIVKIQMIERFLEELNLVYYALSYTWGDLASCVEVDCNGQTISITQNLYDALWQLRENSFEQLLWADAVCINQEDLLEKTAQVRMMRQIFAQATLVFVWLGKEADSDRNAFELLHDLSRVIVDPLSRATLLESTLDLPSVGLPLVMDGPNNFNDEWSALAQFLERPWFRRLWVLQEYVVAREVLFLWGPLKIDGEAIFRLGIALAVSPVIKFSVSLVQRSSADGSGVGANTAASLAFMRQGFRSGNHLDLFVALASTIQTECTHHVDKVFGIVGLLSSIPVTFVDYTKDIDQVLVDTAILCINEPPKDVNERLLILSVCDPLDQRLDLPSWVPLWKQVSPSKGLLGIKWIANIKHNRSCITVVNDDRSLRCCGKLIDKISCIVRSGPPSNFEHERGNERNNNYRTDLVSWLEEVDAVFSGRDDANAAADLQEQLWRLLCFDSNPQDGKAGQTEYDGYVVFRAWARDWSLISKSAFSGKPQTESSKVEVMAARARWDAKNYFAGMAAFMQIFDANALGRQICLTQMGYGGWVSPAAEVGDDIALIYGNPTPFVLRQRGPDSWSLKGECFVQGLMEVNPEDMECVDTDIVIV